MHYAAVNTTLQLSNIAPDSAAAAAAAEQTKDLSSIMNEGQVHLIKQRRARCQAAHR